MLLVSSEYGLSPFNTICPISSDLLTEFQGNEDFPSFLLCNSPRTTPKLYISPAYGNDLLELTVFFKSQYSGALQLGVHGFSGISVTVLNLLDNPKSMILALKDSSSMTLSLLKSL